MILYLIRHAKDDDRIRGGWSQHPLSPEGRKQAQLLAESIKNQEQSLQIKKIFSSDLTRAMETAHIISKQLGIDVQPTAKFREVNNGDLAGMKNEIAAVQFPEFYWNLMDWTQSYPNGESPSAFYERISAAWLTFSQDLSAKEENCILVTHGGVLQIILCLIHGVPYNHKVLLRRIHSCEIIALKYENNTWSEIK